MLVPKSEINRAALAHANASPGENSMAVAMRAVQGVYLSAQDADLVVEALNAYAVVDQNHDYDSLATDILEQIYQDDVFYEEQA